LSAGLVDAGAVVATSITGTAGRGRVAQPVRIKPATMTHVHRVTESLYSGDR
jgi:hypothetical protein